MASRNVFNVFITKISKQDWLVLNHNEWCSYVMFYFFYIFQKKHRNMLETLASKGLLRKRAAALQGQSKPVDETKLSSDFYDSTSHQVGSNGSAKLHQAQVQSGGTLPRIDPEYSQETMDLSGSYKDTRNSDSRSPHEDLQTIGHPSSPKRYRSRSRSPQDKKQRSPSPRTRKKSPSPRKKKSKSKKRRRSSKERSVSRSPSPDAHDVMHKSNKADSPGVKDLGRGSRTPSLSPPRLQKSSPHRSRSKSMSPRERWSPPHLSPPRSRSPSPAKRKHKKHKREKKHKRSKSRSPSPVAQHKGRSRSPSPIHRRNSPSPSRRKRSPSSPVRMGRSPSPSLRHKQSPLHRKSQSPGLAQAPRLSSSDVVPTESALSRSPVAGRGTASPSFRQRSRSVSPYNTKLSKSSPAHDRSRSKSPAALKSSDAKGSRKSRSPSVKRGKRSVSRSVSRSRSRSQSPKSRRKRRSRSRDRKRSVSPKHRRRSRSRSPRRKRRRSRSRDRRRRRSPG